MAEDKGHKPSKKRIEDARQKEGKTLKSPLATQGCVFLLCLISALVTFKIDLLDFKMLLEYTLGRGLVSTSLVELWLKLGISLIAPPLLVAITAAILVDSLQVGIRVSLQPLAFNADRLNLANGIQRLFGSLKELWLIGLKLIAILFVVFWYIATQLSKTHITLAGGLIETTWQWSGFIAVSLGILAPLCLVEYWWKRHLFYRELSMSRDELVREHREEEGDPHIKAERKALHQQLALQEVARRIRRSTALIVEKR